MNRAKALGLVGLLALLPGCDGVVDLAPSQARYSAASFDHWLAADKTRKTTFERFESFLGDRGVLDVVLAWQLLRTDANYAAQCGIGAFELPPEVKWPAIVPTLRLVEQEVIPVVGRVEVVASNRSDELNDCVDGAKGSRHLGFAAVDLIAPDRTDKRQMFADLCAMHRRVGANSRMGLGAYFDPAWPSTNRQGRFHIDQSGFRTWGLSYKRDSSACLTMHGTH